MTASSDAPTLKRRIGLGLLTVYGVGVMVGAGVYVLVGEVAASAGPATPLAFMLAGIAAAFTALSFAELSVRVPESAGEASYARAAFGSNGFALLVGASVALLGLLSGATVLRGGVGYLASIVDLPDWALVIGLGLFLTGAAIVGVFESLALAGLFTVVEIGGLLLVAGAGFIAEPAVVAPVEWTGAGLAGAVFLAFFAFIGFEDMVNLAEETKNPRRVLPRAILIALGVVAVIYTLVSFAAVRAVGPAALAASDAPLATVWTQATGADADVFAGVAVLAAANGVLAQMVMAARIGFGLGRRVPALRFLYHAHPRFGTPVRATLLAAAIAMGLALIGDVGALATAATFAILTVFAVMNAALIVLKRRTPPAADAFSVGLWVPAAGLVVCVGLLGAGLLAFI